MSKSLRDFIFGFYVTVIGAFFLIVFKGPGITISIGLMMIGFTICVIGWRRPD